MIYLELLAKSIFVIIGMLGIAAIVGFSALAISHFLGMIYPAACVLVIGIIVCVGYVVGRLDGTLQ